MNNDSLFNIYPWYRQHQHAVDTIASYLAIELEQVLMGLDGKMNPQEQYAITAASEAA